MKKPRHKRYKDIDLRVQAWKKRARREGRPLIEIMVEQRQDMRYGPCGRVEFRNSRNEWIGLGVGV